METKEIHERLWGLKRLIESSHYGQVEYCRYEPPNVCIKVTQGFDGSLRTTSNLGTLITNYIPEFPVIVSCSTQENLFLLTLTAK